MLATKLKPVIGSSLIDTVINLGGRRGSEVRQIELPHIAVAVARERNIGDGVTVGVYQCR